MARLIGLLTVSAVGSMTIAGMAHADEILLKSGDRITGKIISAADGKMLVTPDFAPTTQISLSQSDVATFTTTAPLVLKLKDGTVVNQAVQKGDPGQIVIARGGTLASQPIDLRKVDFINPKVAPPPAWHGSVGANALYSNASTTSLLLGVSLTGMRSTDLDTLGIHAAYNYGEQSANHLKTKNSDNWSAGAKYSYYFAHNAYGYAGVETAGDQVNFLRLRFTPSVGAGYRWVNRPDFHVTTDAGVAWIYEDYSTLGKASSATALSASYHIDKSWDAARMVFFHDLQVLPALQGSKFLAVADAGLRTNLSKSMYSEIRGDLAYDNSPAPGANKTSTQLKFGLGWTY